MSSRTAGMLIFDGARAMKKRIAELESDNVKMAEAHAEYAIKQHNKIIGLEAENKQMLERVCQWAIKMGLATGHADNLGALLVELGEQIEEIRERRDH